MAARIDDADIRRVADWLCLFVEPGQVVELRAIKVRLTGDDRSSTRGGFFDTAHLDQMAREALYLSQFAAGVYFTLNPLEPAILARRRNHTGPATQQARTENV